MIYGVLVLLDALGTKVGSEEMENKVFSFDMVDQKIKTDTKKLKLKLGSYGYNNLLISGSIYDNIQIFLPIDLHIPGHIDCTGKNDLWWSIIIMGTLLIDIFRYALVNKTPFRGCITSGCGVISKSKRILGPIAEEASEFYEIADWIGIIASPHTAMVLNTKVELNPNPEIFEPFIKYPISIKKKNNICNNNDKKIENKDYWALKWPIQQGFTRKDSEKLIYVIPSNKKTFYGKTISNSKIEEVLEEGVRNSSHDISQKWKNTLEFYKFVINDNC
jgi:hypothetical protein